MQSLRPDSTSVPELLADRSNGISETTIFARIPLYAASLAALSLISRLNKRGCFDARNVETFAAAHVLAHYFVVQQDHVASGLTELGAVPLIGIARQPIHF